MVEGVLGTCGEPHLIDQLRTEQLVDNRIDPQRGQQLRVEAGSDHRRRGQRPFGRDAQPVDARPDGGLHRGRHVELGDIRSTDVATAPTGQRPALHQVTHHLLGEKRVPGGPLGDDRRQFIDRWIGTQQVAEQRRGVRIIQWSKRYRLSGMYPRQCSLVLGAGRDHHHRLGLRDHREEVGHHRLADGIDPVRVLDDEQRRLRARQGSGVDQRGQPAPAGLRVDWGQRHIGVGDAEQVIEQQQILRIGVVKSRPQLNPCGFAIKVGHAGARPQQSRHRLERNVAGVGFAEGPKHLDPTAGRQLHDLPRHPALADARRSHHVHDATVAADRAVDDRVEDRHLPVPADQAGLGAPDHTIPRSDRHQLAHRHRLVGPLDAHQLGVLQDRGVLDQKSGGLTEHHPTRRSDRLHPLRIPDRLADRGVTRYTRTHLTGNDPARIQAHPQLQRDFVTTSHLGGEMPSLSLNVQRSQTRPDCVILQRHRRAEQRHQTITGELFHRAAVALYHRRAAADQLGHDLAQSLSTHRRRDVHRAHHIGEQHSHLLVLRCVSRSRS